MDEEQKLIFKKIFMNLPSKIKKEDVIAVIDRTPYSWGAAYFEINNETEEGEKILKKLLEMNLL